MPLNCFVQREAATDWPYCDFKLHLLTEIEVLYQLQQIRKASAGRVDSVIASQISGVKHEC